MVRRITVAVIFLAWVGSLGVLVYFLQDNEIKKLIYQRPFRGTLNLPRIIDSEGNEIGEDGAPKLAEAMALGYDNMVASVLWLRVIQAFGAQLQHVREKPQVLQAIENLFWVVTELDPRFIDAYKFGNFILGDEGDDTDAALRLLNRGMVKNQNRTYRLAFDAVFICLQNLKDYDLARYYVLQAMKAPDCPPHVARFLYHIDVKKGNYEIALERWVRESLQAHADNNAYIHDIARQQISSITNEWHISIIDAAIDRYFERFEDYPARLAQLVREGMTTKTRQVDAKRFLVLLDGAEDNAIPHEQAVGIILGTENTSGTIVESENLPLDQNGEPYLLIDEAVIPIQQRPLVVERKKIREQGRMEISAIRRRLEDYKRAHGKYPERLEDLPQMQPGSPERLNPKDPTGVPWKYDPKTGKLGSHTLPEI